MKVALKTALLLAAGFALAASPAFAHAHLAGAEPADGAIVTVAPAALTLKFTEGLALAFSGVTVAGPGGLVPQGPAMLDPTNDAVLVVPLAGPLPAGRYSVDWHALSSDGHKTTGRYSFTVK